MNSPTKWQSGQITQKQELFIGVIGEVVFFRLVETCTLSVECSVEGNWWSYTLTIDKTFVSLKSISAIKKKIRLVSSKLAISVWAVHN